MTVLQLRFQNKNILPEKFGEYLKKSYTNLGLCYTFGSDQVGHMTKNQAANQPGYDDHDSEEISNFQRISYGILGTFPNWLISILGLVLPDHEIHKQKFLKHHAALNRTKEVGPNFGLSIILDVKQDNYSGLFCKFSV